MQGLTEKELSQLFYLNRECEQIQKDIQDKQQKLGYKSPLVTDMPRGNVKDPTNAIDDIADLEAIMRQKLVQIQEERQKIENFLTGIPDAETRLIFRLRHVNCMTWEEIGDEVNMDRRTAARKYYRCLKVAHNAR